MARILRFLFFLCIVRPLVLIVLGLNVRRRELLPANGPAILVANHNSHLDVMALMSLFSLKQLQQLRPVAAADYFLKNRWLAWFSTQIIGIIPLERQLAGVRSDPLGGICGALDQGAILILFPEGSRGEPEQFAEFRNGIAHVARRYPEVPVVPVFLHGLGKALPKGEALLVPFFVDVFIGQPLSWTGNRDEYMRALQSRFDELRGEGYHPEWT